MAWSAESPFLRAVLHTLRALGTVLPRILPRLLLIGAALTAAALLIIVVFAQLASPSIQQTMADLPFDGTLNQRMIVLIVLWGIVPALGLIAASILVLAATFLLSDAALTKTRPFTLRVVADTMSRLWPGLLVVLAVIVGILPLFYFAVRWALALPEVFVRGVSAREALRRSWRLSRGHVLRIYITMGLTLLVVITLSVAVSALADRLPWEHSVIITQAVLSALIAPVPVIVLTWLWRDLSGRADAAGDPDAPEPNFVAERFGTALPTALSALLVVTLLAWTPPPVAYADDALGAGSEAPALFGELDDEVDDGDGGDDDDDDETLPTLNVYAEFTSANDTIVVGDVVSAIVVAADDSGEPYPGATGTIQILRSLDRVVLGSGTLTGGTGTAELGISARSLSVIVEVDMDPPFAAHSIYEEYVFEAEAAPSTTSLSSAHRMSYGDPLTVTAQIVGGASSVRGAGTVYWEMRMAHTTAMPIGESTVTNGEALTEVCIESRFIEADCPGVETLRVGARDGEMMIRARFVPNGMDDDYHPLLPSESDWHRVPIGDPLPPVIPDVEEKKEVCRFVELRPRTASGHDRRLSETEPIGYPRIANTVNCHDRDDWGNHWGSGFTNGTLLTLNANPATGMELYEWRHNGAVISTAPTLDWRVAPSAEAAIYIEAVYRPICVPPAEITVSGYGRAIAYPQSGDGYARPDLFPSPLCPLHDGSPGIYAGAEVRVQVPGQHNPVTGEPDVFYAARVNGAPAATQTSWDGRTEFTYTARRGSRAEVTFGPRCRDVDAPGSLVLTAPNCTSPAGEGYLRNSDVDVAVDLDALDEYQIPTEWFVDGTVVPASPTVTPERGTFSVQEGDTTTITFAATGCFPVDIRIAETRAGWSTIQGSHVGVFPPANCGTANDRWLEGTKLHLTPHHGTQTHSFHATTVAPKFAGWRDTDSDGTVHAWAMGSDWQAQSHMAGEIKFNGARILTIDAPLVTEASFYNIEICSEITVAWPFSIADLAIPDSGCGPGRYLDEARLEMDSDRPWLTTEEFNDYLHPASAYTLNFSVLNADAGVQGTADMNLDTTGPWQSLRWKATKPLDCEGRECSVAVSGDVILRLQQCLTIDARVNIRRAGDASGTVYSPADFGLDEENWLTSRTETCGLGLDGWRPGKNVAVEPDAPAMGFVFDSWGESPGLQRTQVIQRCDDIYGCRPEEHESVPQAVVTFNREGLSHPVEVNFTLHCSRPGVAVELAIVNPAPNCPGASGAGQYIDGTILHLAAIPTNAAGRDFKEFEGTGLNDTFGVYIGRAKDFARADTSTGLDWWPHTAREYPSILAIASPDSSVWGYYQHPPGFWDDFVSVVSNAGKFTVGTISTVSMALTTLCAPCTAAIAAITLSEVLLRVFGADGIANVIAMMNPMYMAECISRWGYQSLPPATHRQATPEEGARAGGALVAGAAVKGAKTMFAKDSAAFNRLTDASAKAKVAGAATQVALSLYSYEIYNFRFTGASKADLRDTAAFLSCVTNTYKAP